MLAAVAVSALLSASLARAQGPIATNPNGPTNPSAPTLGTPLNQQSDSRLISLNSYDDFCLYGPPEFVPETTTLADGSIKYESNIGNTEPYVVAWCTKPRNNARLIPDGVITAAHFVKTDYYVQIRGFGDLTQLNIPYGDYGGELDPHGAYNLGNPVGGNATSNVTGADVFYAEWMMFVSYSQFCLRICIAEGANSTYTVGEVCEHKLDVMGCDFVMPAVSPNNSYTSCDADVAYPPGVYPLTGAGGQVTGYSTFEQYYEGTYTNPEGQEFGYTVGTTVTPAAPFSTPSSSNCVTHTSPSNGVTAVQINPEFNQGAYTVTDGSSVPRPSGSGSGTGTNTGTDTSGRPSGSSGASSGTRSASGTRSGSTGSPSSSADGESGSRHVTPVQLPMVALVATLGLVVVGALAIVA